VTDRLCQPPARSWKNRILIAAVVAILSLTLYPFRFESAAKQTSNASPFLLLGTMGKEGSPVNIFLNILLFVPFGFGIAGKLRERGKRPWTTLLLALGAGALFSYCIEFLQVYVPGRDTGWEDVCTNTIGTAIGCLLFAVMGSAAERVLSATEGFFRTLPARQIAAILAVYLGFWCLLSIPLQRETRLSDWDPNAFLLAGNDFLGRANSAWKGQVSLLQIWDRHVTDETARRLAAGENPEEALSGRIASYDFSKPSIFAAPAGTSSGPAVLYYRDETGHLPPLTWIAGHRLILAGPVTTLVDDLRHTNQFALRVVCAPEEGEGALGRIVSIAQRTDAPDLTVRQENFSLIFWFRTPLSARQPQFFSYTPAVFTPGRPRDILFSYDGAALSLFLDGKREPNFFRLGPGAALVRLFARLRTPLVEGYYLASYAVVFAPCGVLLAILAGMPGARKAGAALCLLAWFLVPPVALELILRAVSGRPLSFGNVILSLALCAGGCLWMQADGSAGAKTSSVPEQTPARI